MKKSLALAVSGLVLVIVPLESAYAICYVNPQTHIPTCMDLYVSPPPPLPVSSPQEINDVNSIVSSTTSSKNIVLANASTNENTLSALKPGCGNGDLKCSELISGMLTVCQ